MIHGRDACDADLTNEAALAALARHIPNRASLVTSSLRRAVQTSDALRRFEPNLPAARTEPDFDEQDFGAWTGRRWTDIGLAASAFWHDPVEAAPPGGESYADLARRTWRGVESIGASATSDDIVCVAHAGTIRTALALALGGDLAASLRFEIAPLSLTRLDSINADGRQTWRIGAVNVPAR